MAVQLQPGEQVLFPAPYVPTEFQPLVVSNKRVLQFTGGGSYPISEFEVAQLDFMGRMSERPFLALAVLIGALGLILVIVGGYKLLPPILYAGHTGGSGDGPQATADGRMIEGKNDDDEYPFFDKEIQEKSLKQRTEQLKKLSEIKPGIPPFNNEVKMGLLFFLLAAGALIPAMLLYKKEEHYILCRTKDGNLYRVDVAGEMQMNMVLASLQAAQQAAAATGGR